MGTITVKDAAGLDVELQEPLAPGRAAATASGPVVLSNEDKAAIDALVEATGEATATPAANTVLARLKAIADGVSGMAGSVDGLEALATTLNGLVDQVEGLIGTTNTSLGAIGGYVDGLEGLATQLNGFVDGLETLQGTTNSTLATLAGYVDGLEALATALNGYVDGLEAGQLAQLDATKLVGTRAYGAGLARVAVAAASAQSAAIAATEVLVHASTRCFIATGLNPTATTNDVPIEAGEKFTLRITSGHKVAVIRDTADGYLNVVPVVG